MIREPDHHGVGVLGYRTGQYGDRVREERRATFAEDHTREIAGSFALGVLLLGPVEGVGLADASFPAVPGIVARLPVGTLVLAVVAYRTTEVGEGVEEASMGSSMTDRRIPGIAPLPKPPVADANGRRRTLGRRTPRRSDSPLWSGRSFGNAYRYTG